ncbi:MAG: uridine kinase [Nakamurella sp.]
MRSSDAVDTVVGITAAVRLALSRPARLGATRLVAVDGPSGSGKTSLAGPLAQALAGAIGGQVVRPKRYAEPRIAVAELVSARTASYVTVNGVAEHHVTVVSTDLLATWEQPLDWWPVLDDLLLAPLAAGKVAILPVIEWSTGNPRPGGCVVVPPVEVLVLEGVSSGQRAATDRLSALVWVEVPGERARLERAVARDGEQMRPYLARWQVSEAAHFAAESTAARADIVIDPR